MENMQKRTLLSSKIIGNLGRCLFTVRIKSYLIKCAVNPVVQITICVSIYIKLRVQIRVFHFTKIVQQIQLV
jgi:hypothetical protein